VEKIIASELGRHDLRGDKTASVDCGQQIFDEDRLASADLTGDDDETCAVSP